MAPSDCDIQKIITNKGGNQMNKKLITFITIITAVMIFGYGVIARSISESAESEGSDMPNTTDRISVSGQDYLIIDSQIDPQFDVFNLYDKTNNVTGKYIDNNGAIQTSGTGGTYAVVPVENGKTYTICRIGYQSYESGRMLVVKEDKTTVLATVNLDSCTSVNYEEYIAKKYTVSNELAAYILFNVKLGSGDSIDSTIVTERDINGTQETIITELYNTPIPTKQEIVEINNKIEDIDDVQTQRNRVSLLITEGKFQVRSAWNNTNDIAITGKLHGSSNGAMSFDNLVTIAKSSQKDTYGGTTFCYIGDDVAPIKLKNTYIGGNHGYPASYTLTTSSDHGITTADIGKSFTDASSNTYIILAVPTTKTIYVCSTFTGDLDAPILATAPTSPATINGNSLAFTSSTVQQLRPAINNVSVRVIVDGEREIDTDKIGVYDGSFVDISEEYTVVNIGEMLAYLADNIGENDNNSYHSDAISGYCKVTNRYRFTERGAVTLYYNLVWYTENEIEYIGAIQTAAVGGSYISVPGTEHGEIYNMGTTTTNFGTSTWNNSDKPPRAFYDFSDSSMSTGMVVGYHNIGSGNDDVRKDTIANACQYYGSTHKLYPRIYAKSSEPVVVGQLITAIAYRTPSYTSSGNPFVSWYYVDGIPYVMVNVQSNYTGYIKLPDYFCGKIAEIVETDGSFDLITPFVNTDGLYINVSGYGYAVIRLAEKAKVATQGGNVTDVQINGTSILSDGIANVPVAGASAYGVMKIGTGSGGVELKNGELRTAPASSNFIKAGSNGQRPIVPYNQHEAVFYGLAKLAGVDLKNETVTVGQYPANVQAAIKTMLGIS